MSTATYTPHAAKLERPERLRALMSEALVSCSDGALLRERRAAAMVNLETLGALRALVEAEIRDNIATARTAASTYYDYNAPTWAEIGNALGVTKQAAAARYRDVAPRKE